MGEIEVALQHYLNSHSDVLVKKGVGGDPCFIIRFYRSSNVEDWRGCLNLIKRNSHGRDLP